MKNKKIISIIILIIGVLLIIVGTILFTKKSDNTNNSNNSEDYDVENRIEKFEDFYNLKEDLYVSIDFDKSCILDNDISKKQKICFNSLKESDMETIEEDSVTQEKGLIKLFAKNYDVRLDRTSMFNADSSDFESKDLTKFKNKISRIDKDEFSIEIYHYIYYGGSKATSVLYIFASNEKNNVFIKYTINDKIINEALEKEIIDSISVEQITELPTKSKKVGNNLEVTLERAGFYKNNNGKLVERDFDDNDLTYYLDYIISASDYKEVESVDSDNNTISFSNVNGSYTMTILLDNGNYLSLKDIEQTNSKSYNIISINDNYTLNNKTLLKQEYTYNDSKYLEYYYLNNLGFYVKYQFKANNEYTYNYDEIEKLLNFELKENI